MDLGNKTWEEMKDVLHPAGTVEHEIGGCLLAPCILRTLILLEDFHDAQRHYQGHGHDAYVP